MKNEIWKYKDYKDLLTDKITAEKGLSKSGLAKACNCQSAYISQILNGHANLSAEQLLSAGEYINLSESEIDFFILLHSFNKAGTSQLRKYYKTKIDEFIEHSLNLSKRLDVKNTLTEDEKAKYYSSWLYTVIHLMTTLPEKMTIERISSHLSITQSKASDVTNFLQTCGLIQKKNNYYLPGKTRFHLDSNSHLLPLMHLNSRNLVIEKIQKFKTSELSSNLIYSSAITLSKDDFKKIKNILISAIQDSKEIIKDSSEEVLGLFNLDFIEIN